MTLEIFEIQDGSSLGLVLLIDGALVTDNTMAQSIVDGQRIKSGLDDVRLAGVLAEGWSNGYIGIRESREGSDANALSQ